MVLQRHLMTARINEATGTNRAESSGPDFFHRVPSRLDDGHAGLRHRRSEIDFVTINRFALQGNNDDDDVIIIITRTVVVNLLYMHTRFTIMTTIPVIIIIIAPRGVFDDGTSPPQRCCTTKGDTIVDGVSLYVRLF